MNHIRENGRQLSMNVFRHTSCDRMPHKANNREPVELLIQPCRAISKKSIAGRINFSGNWGSASLFLSEVVGED
jgi:hypothetical protein